MENTTSLHKTKIEPAVVQQFLNNYYSKDVSNLVAISGGEGSQAFSFTLDGKDLIIRVNKHNDRGFQKDRYAYDHFSSALIPIPEIKDIGTMEDGQHFAISEKVQGVLFKDLSEKEFDESLPSLLKTLDAIHAVDISATRGFGNWNQEGEAPHKSWKDVLADVDEFVEGLFENSIPEKGFWDEAYGKYKELIDFCPEVRHLIHSDYNFDNVLAMEERVTGVIDWANSMYGDFLYDVAWMQFFAKDFDYEQAYLDFHSSKREDVHNFHERVLCYEAYIGLSSLSFYAYSNQKEKYERSKEKLCKILKIEM